MTSYELGRRLGIEKSAGPISWALKLLGRGASKVPPRIPAVVGAGLKAVPAAARSLGRGARAMGARVATKGRKIKQVLTQPITRKQVGAAATYPLRHPVGTAEAALLGAAAPSIYRGMTAKEPTEVELSQMQEEALSGLTEEMRQRLGLAEPGAAPAGTAIKEPTPQTDWLKWLTTQQDLGQTGLKVHPLGGLIGALGGLGLGAMRGGGEEEDEEERSLLAHPAVLATLLGGAGAFLPGLLGGGKAAPATTEAAA